MGALLPRPARSISAGRNARTRVLTNLVKNMQVFADEGGDPGQTTGAKRVAQAPEVASHLVDSRLDFALLTKHTLAQI